MNAVPAVVLTAAMVVQATGGRLVRGDAGSAFDGVSIDTRTVTSGALFVAIQGERFDGHAFLGDAVGKGAAGVLVSRAESAPSQAVVIEVPDTLRALQALGRAVRRQSGARVVAITGSAGKTTTKEVTAELLAAQYRVFRNRGNLNNHIGLPLSLTELRHGPEIAVVELGMNHEGEIRQLVAIAEPDVRVWTNVGDAHIGYFESRDAIARAKAEVLEGGTSATLLVANADDPLVRRHADGWSGRRLLFGESESADIRAVDVRDAGFDGTHARVRTPSGALALDVLLPGRAQLQNVLAAVAVAHEFRIPSGAVEKVVHAIAPVARRGESVRLANGARLIDDSYNASPAAVRAMLLALAATPATGRRVAVLGQMLELGARSQALHEACGRAAAEAGVDELIAIGGVDADALSHGAVAAGLSPSAVHRFEDSVSAAPAVARLARAGDIVLVKGSRGTRTDIVADRLREAA